jgi:diguanylate cyclase (GGDEF)-like protein
MRDSSAAPSGSHSFTGGFNPLQLLVAAAALIWTAARFPSVFSADPATFAICFLAALVARCTPVAPTRETPITFTPAFVLVSLQLCGAPAAAVTAIAVSILHGRLLSRETWSVVLYRGSRYALAALVVERLIPSPLSAGSAAAQAAAYAAAMGILAVPGQRSPGRWTRARAAHARLEAFAVLVSFPCALLLALAYRTWGWAALPLSATGILIGAYAVRMTVENRTMSRQLRAIEQLGRICASGVRGQEAMERFLDLSRGFVQFEAAQVWVPSQEPGLFEPAVCIPPEAKPAPSPHDTELLLRVMRRSKPLLLKNVSRIGDAAGPHESRLLIPFGLPGQPVGVAQFVRTAHHPFRTDDLHHIALLAPQAAVAFVGATVRHQMHRYQDLAVTDGLTGLYNHRHIQELLRDELRRARRYGRPLSLLMLDVDGFKLFNDTYGHPQGDVLLQSLASILRANVRSVDHVGRYGGEEFMVLLPETVRSDAVMLAERIRNAVERTPYQLGESASVRVTVSIGVAASPQDASEADLLVQLADQALYRAKRDGRNLVVTA